LASFCRFCRAGARGRARLARREDRRVERADGARAAREGAALIAVEAREPHERAAVARIGVERGEEPKLGAAHPVDIERRLGDPAGKRVAGRIGRAAGQRRLDAAGERGPVERSALRRLARIFAGLVMRLLCGDVRDDGGAASCPGARTMLGRLG
jgi:hypothetical protein